ncbi:MAG: recombinase RecT [Oscillospiraceae bacterium]|nr:recombinase RecT [Oscillospiraceae bacterium]
MENKIMTSLSHTMAQAEAEAKQLSTANVWTDKAAFDQMLRVANMLSQSAIVPQNYQGKPQDCFIAVEMASRMNLSPVVVMQNLYVVKGKPSWSGSSCFALIESCGKFRNVRHVEVGTRGTASWGCYVTAERISDGTPINGTTVTMAMAQAEGWTSNAKWKNMPEQMLKYRASAFFARAYCPEALMGLQTTEEVEDATPTNAANLNAELDADQEDK